MSAEQVPTSVTLAVLTTPAKSILDAKLLAIGKVNPNRVAAPADVVSISTVPLQTTTLPTRVYWHRYAVLAATLVVLLRVGVQVLLEIPPPAAMVALSVAVIVTVLETDKVFPAVRVKVAVLAGAVMVMPLMSVERRSSVAALKFKVAAVFTGRLPDAAVTNNGKQVVSADSSAAVTVSATPALATLRLLTCVVLTMVIGAVPSARVLDSWPLMPMVVTFVNAPAFSVTVPQAAVPLVPPLFLSIWLDDPPDGIGFPDRVTRQRLDVESYTSVVTALGYNGVSTLFGQ